VALHVFSWVHSRCSAVFSGCASPVFGVSAMT